MAVRSEQGFDRPKTLRKNLFFGQGLW